MKRIILTTLAMMLVGGTWAQTTGELFLFSQNNVGILTARSAAMGGAFTSLGADASSMSINPAGLGMYKSGEVSISPQIRLGNSLVRYTAGAENSNTTSKFSMSNVGAVYSTGGFTFGFGYNRLADYYSNSTSRGSNQSVSITDMFASQLNGISNKDLTMPDNDIYRAFYKLPPVMWGAIQGYQSYAVDNFPGSTTEYGSTLNSGTLVSPTMSRKTEGALDEFTFSMAYNSNDKFYIGLTIGAQSLTYNKYDSYSERAEPSSTPTLDEVIHNRNLYLSGGGVNLKLGAIARPVDWLRIGLSYHSPTWMNVREEADENMTSYFFDDPNKPIYIDTPIYTSKYDTYSPSRLLAGVSATIINRIILSFDYRCTWYNGMGFSTSFSEYGYRPEVTATAIDNYDAIYNNMNSYGDIDLNGIIKQNYGATSQFSFGAEGNLGAGLFLRAGYIYQNSPYKNSSLKDFGTISQISAGLGYRTRSFSVDFAYVNSTSKQLPYQYYSYAGLNPVGSVETKDIVQNFILTVGFRF